MTMMILCTEMIFAGVCGVCAAKSNYDKDETPGVQIPTLFH